LDNGAATFHLHPGTVLDFWRNVASRAVTMARTSGAACNGAIGLAGGRDELADPGRRPAVGTCTARSVRRSAAARNHAPTSPILSSNVVDSNAPVVRWQLPEPLAAAPNREGYVIAGVGGRIVAYLIDAVLVSIVPTILSLILFDYSGLFDQFRRSITTGHAGQAAFVVPMTLDLILVSFISVAIHYLYFVGFWTSGGRATPGLRGLRMQVVDARSGGPLSIGQATRRWAALGAPLALLTILPALQSLAGLIQIGLVVVIFFTVVANDRKQGLHDRWANSLVIRDARSGDRAIAFGCVLLAVLLIGFGIIVGAIAIIALGPAFQQLLIDVGNSI